MIAPGPLKTAMRIGDWKILADERLTQFELYELKNDPQEKTELKRNSTRQVSGDENRAGQTQHRDRSRRAGLVEDQRSRREEGRQKDKEEGGVTCPVVVLLRIGDCSLLTTAAWFAHIENSKSLPRARVAKNSAVTERSVAICFGGTGPVRILAAAYLNSAELGGTIGTESEDSW